MSIIATPMGYVMEYIYNLLQNYGYSVIAFALLAKIILLPLSIKQKKSMIVTQRLNPKLQELQKKYANNQEKYSQEAQKLYDEYGASPMGGCGTTLLTFPIMIGLYYVVTQPLTYFMHAPADQIAQMAEMFDISTRVNGYQLSICGLFAEHFDQLKAVCSAIFPVDFTFFGLDLTATPSFKEFSVLWIIPVLSALTAWGYSHVANTMNQVVAGAPAGDEKAQQMNKTMTLMMPLMSGYFGFILPAAVGIYWIANNLFMCVQDVILTSYCLKQEKKEQELYKTGGKKLK